MAQEQHRLSKRKLPVVVIFAFAIVLVILLAAGGFAFAANAESQDPFCASCHSQPESTFFARSTAAQPVDLASFHATQHIRCIDCHSGKGVSGRLQAELIGARNSFKWFAGIAVQPAVLSFPVGDQNCLKCHQGVVQKGFLPMQQFTIPIMASKASTAADDSQGQGPKNHWHEQLARWQAASSNSGTCVSCHAGHYTGTNSQSGFMDTQNVQVVCNACHQVLLPGAGK